MTCTSQESELRVVMPVVAGVGNALMAMPMVRQLKRALPRARITVIARIDAMGEPFRRMSEVDEVLISGAGFWGLCRQVVWTRQRRPDVYLVPFPSNRWQYNLLAWTSGAPRRVMHAFPVARWRSLGFLPASREPALRGIHDVQQNLRLLRVLGIQADASDRPVFNLSTRDHERAQRLLRAIGIEGEAPFLVIHGGSGKTTLGRAKRWAPMKYAALIQSLRAEGCERIVLIEGPDETGVASEILDACEQRQQRILAGGLAALRLTGPLGDAAGVLARARLYIGSDSGLAHLAAAVGTPAVTIFAPADPDRVCPFGYRDLVVRPDKPCSPCFQYPWKTPYPKMLCREPMCVNEVSVEAVMKSVRIAQSMTKVALS